MVEALILAERRGLDREVRNAFIRTGAAHLLAISGFHVGVLAGWIILLLRMVGLTRGRAALGAALVVWSYIALLGFPTSAVRAGLLLSGAAAGRIRGRPVHPLGAWGLALLVVAFFDPALVTRPGAQLSFAGALGLILWAEPWTRGLQRVLGGDHLRDRPGRTTSAVLSALAASAAAQVATLPMAVWHFQRVAVLALPATLLATPLVSLALPGAFLGLAAQELGLPGATLLCGGVEALLWATRGLMEGMGGWDPGWFLGRTSVALATGAGAGAWLLTRGWARRDVRVAWSGVAVVSALLAAPWAETAVRPRALEIRVLDVGQGDAIAVGTPAGRWILVDTGAGSGERLARGLVAHGIRRLELLVLTHPDLDHMGAAAELMDHLPVRAVADGGSLRGTDAYRGLVAAARQGGVPWRALHRGAAWEMDGVRFRVLHPSADGAAAEPNDRSVVLQVTWGEFDVLLTGDISVEVERDLVPHLRPVEVLKVAHHGSRTSTGGPFLTAVRPEISVISVGRGNRFGHPALEVLGRLGAAGVTVARTDLQGTIVIRGRRDGTHTMHAPDGEGD
jgi:competence protein ComEC